MQLPHAGRQRAITTAARTRPGRSSVTPRPDVRLATTDVSVTLGPGTLTVRTPDAQRRVCGLPPALADAVQRMTADPTAIGDVDTRAAQLLLRLAPRHTSLQVRDPDGTVLGRLVAASPSAVLPRFLPGADRSLARLTPHAVVRSERNCVIVESGFAAWDFVTDRSDVAARVGRLAIPTQEAGSTLAGVLVAAGLAEFADTGGRFARADPSCSLWGAHERLVHRRSRRGLTTRPVGAGTLRPTPPARTAPASASPSLTLPPVQLGPRLRGLLDARRSIRRFDPRPVTMDDLAGLLAALGKGDYPSGGAAYELEIYLSVRRCSGLEPDTYRFDPTTRSVRRLHARAADRKRLLAAGAFGAEPDQAPDVVISLVSDLPNLSAKYRGMAYSLTLRHVGVLTQNLYLAAAETGLGICALGLGDDDAAHRAFAIDGIDRVVVGEVAVGRRPADDRNDQQTRDQFQIDHTATPNFQEGRP